MTARPSPFAPDPRRESPGPRLRQDLRSGDDIRGNLSDICIGLIILAAGVNVIRVAGAGPGLVLAVWMFVCGSVSISDGLRQLRTRRARISG